MAVDAMNERFEEVEFQGKTVLFTDCRVQKDTIPEGLHRYEIRHTDDDWGEPCQLGYGIVVNHFGTLISNEAIQLDPSGHLDFDADDMNFLGNGYGFQIEMPEHQYFLRCNPSCGDYNFYLYCADKEAQRLFERDRDKVSEKKLSIIQKLRDTSKQEAKITAPKKSAEMEI